MEEESRCMTNGLGKLTQARCLAKCPIWAQNINSRTLPSCSLQSCESQALLHEWRSWNLELCDS